MRSQDRALHYSASCGKNLTVPGRPCSLFSNFLNGLLFEVCSFTLSWDNSDYIFGWGCKPQSWGRGGHRGRGWYHLKEHWWVSCRPSKVTFPSIFSHLRDIAAFVLQHATFSHPTSIPPQFPHVSLEVGGWFWGFEERRCWANCAILQLALHLNRQLYGADPPTSQMDTWTDYMQLQYRALH